MTQYQFTPLTFLWLGVFFICLQVAVGSWRRRAVPGALYLSLCEFSAAHWAFCAIFEASAVSLNHKIFWYMVSYPGVSCSGPFFFLFAATYSQQRRQVTPRYVALIFSVPVLTVLTVFTNRWHGLYWRDVYLNPSINMEVFVRGPLFWIATLGAYLLIGAGILLLCLASFRFSRFYQKQTLCLLTGCIVPFVANIFYVSNLNPIPGLDWTLVSFCFSGLIFSWGLFRGSVFRHTPVARDQLMDLIDDGVLVLDRMGLAADVNSTFRQFLDRPVRDVIGKSARELFDSKELLAFLAQDRQMLIELPFVRDGKQRFYHFRQTLLSDRRHKLIGRVLSLRDVTADKDLEEEKVRLAQGLKDALAYVKTLSGLLPICAQCKKIRDDHGQWQPVEEYVQERTHAEFSHGICPDCARRLYPDDLDGII